MILGERGSIFITFYEPEITPLGVSVCICLSVTVAVHKFDCFVFWKGGSPNITTYNLITLLYGILFTKKKMKRVDYKCAECEKLWWFIFLMKSFSFTPEKSKNFLKRSNVSLFFFWFRFVVYKSMGKWRKCKAKIMWETKFVLELLENYRTFF